MHLLVSLFVILATAFQEYEKSIEEYELVCSDGLPAIQKGIHACCTIQERETCVLCAQLSIDYYDACTNNCRGSIIETYPHHEKVECRPLSKEQLEEKQKRYFETKEPAHSGCPYLKRKQEEERKEKEEM